VTLGRSPTWRRGSDGGKPVRRTPGRWGRSVRCSGVDGRDEWGTGEKNLLAASGSLLRGWRGTPERGGVLQRGCHVAWGAWGLAPIGGRRLDHVPVDRDPATARAGGAPLFQQWRTDVADAWGSVGVRQGHP
jgi:hypothetical protein